MLTCCVGYGLLNLDKLFVVVVWRLYSFVVGAESYCVSTYDP